MLLYTMLCIVLAYLMLFAALTNSVCLNNASFFFLFKYFLCQGYELSGEIIKDVKGWCISWIKGKVIPVFTIARKKRRSIDMILTKRYKESAAVTPCAR